MKVRIIVGAAGAYACITDPGFSLDVRLSAGRSAAQSLRQSAEEIRADVARRLERAQRMERAADILEKGSAE